MHILKNVGGSQNYVCVIKDRFELSIQNEWVDKNNNIYFIFSNKHLCEYLGYAEQKL